MKKKVSVVFVSIMFIVSCMFFWGCKEPGKSYDVGLAELRSQLAIDVTGAKAIGGGSVGGTARSSLVLSRSVDLASSPLVKFLGNGTCESIFESLPPYNNMAYCNVEELIVSPDGSLYVIWGTPGAPRFSNYTEYTAYYGPSYMEWEEGDDEPVELVTGDIWRITKDGELQWMDKDGNSICDLNNHEYNPAVGFHWRYNEELKCYPMDEDGNLYGFKWPPVSESSSIIMKLNPTTMVQTQIAEISGYLQPFILCKGYILEICTSGSASNPSYIPTGKINVYPIANSTNSYTLDEDYKIYFYDSINNVLCGRSYTGDSDTKADKFYYSPFTSESAVSLDATEISDYKEFVTGLIRDDKVYFVVSTDGGYKVCPVTYSASEHKYTLESDGSIDYNPGSVYDFPECEQKHINKNGYFFWNSDSKKFIFIDGSDGTRTELGTNLPDNGNLTIVDFAVTDTEIYFTASREGESLYTPTFAGKVNISTGDYTDTNLSISVNAMTVVDF